MCVIKSLLHISLPLPLILSELLLFPCVEKVLVFSDISTKIAIKMINKLIGEMKI